MSTINAKKLSRRRVPLLIPPETYDRLQAIAEARGLQTGTLCGQVLDAISRVPADRYLQALAAIETACHKK